MSDACPCAPPEGWWIITRAFGSAKRLPFAPAAQQERAHAGGDAHAQRADTSGFTNSIVSKIDRPAETDPPGELM